MKCKPLVENVSEISLMFWDNRHVNRQTDRHKF